MSDTFVLITGAWHGGWAWRPLAERLRAAGHAAHTPTLPGLADGDDPTGLHLSDVVDSVVSYVEDRDLTDITLVGHSWGGYPITGAAPRLASRLRKLVYWSAFVPSAGRSLFDEVPPAFQEMFTGLAAASGNNTVSLPFEVWANGFIADAPEPVQRLVHELLVPQPLQYFTETVEPLDPATLGVPVSYVFSRDDVALPPDVRFAERLGVTAVDAPGSHEALFTDPAGLAAVLMQV
jgi:pimeloyl-ACP methyl ester carboxylesterase